MPYLRPIPAQDSEITGKIQPMVGYSLVVDVIETEHDECHRSCSLKTLNVAKFSIAEGDAKTIFGYDTCQKKMRCETRHVVCIIGQTSCTCFWIHTLFYYFVSR